MLARSTLLITTLLLLGGCEEKGPAETLGERIDESAAELRNQAEEAGEELSERIDEATN